MDEGSLSDTQRTMVLPLLQETNIRGKPYITVSAKGIVNGLSRYPNDGADFGPDTTLNATAPGQYGGTYTETSGIQEAWNNAISVGIDYNLTLSSILAPAFYFIPEIHLLSGAFIIKKGITFSASHLIQNFKLTGDASMSPYIVMETNDGLFTFDASTFANTNLEIDNIAPATASGYTPAYVIKADFSSVGQSNLFQSYNLDTGGTFQAGVILNNFIQANFYNYQTYCPAGDQLTSVGTINYFGGQLGGAAGTSGVTPHTYSGAITNIAFYAVNNILPVKMSSSAVTFISFYDSAIQSITLTNITCYINIFNCINAPGQTSPLITVPSSQFSVIYLLTIRGLVLGTSASIYLNDTSLLAVGDIDIKGVYPTDTLIPSLVPLIPSVPTSGTAQENTNLYSVDVYLYGGTVTEIQVTKNGTANTYTVFSNATGIALSGQVYKLNPGDSIIVTYTTAPTWEWLSD